MQSVDDLTTSEYNEMDEFSFVGVWTCNNDLPDEEEHVMDEDEVETLEEMAKKFGVHHHTNCTECEVYNRAFEGDLDRVLVVDDDDRVVDRIDPSILVNEYGMTDDFGKYK